MLGTVGLPVALALLGYQRGAIEGGGAVEPVLAGGQLGQDVLRLDSLRLTAPAALLQGHGPWTNLVQMAAD